LHVACILTRNEDEKKTIRNLRDIIYKYPRKKTIRKKNKVMRGKRSHRETKEENRI